MATLQDAVTQQVATVSTTALTAIPVVAADDHPLRLGGRIPLIACNCVTEPCPCDLGDGPIIWMKEEDIRQRRETGRKTRSGEALYDYRIDDDATVITETFECVKLDSLQGRSDSSLSSRAQLNGHAPFNAPGAPGFTIRRLRSKATLERDAPGAYYSGQGCGGHTLYDIYTEADGLDTIEHYIAVGSC